MSDQGAADAAHDIADIDAIGAASIFLAQDDVTLATAVAQEAGRLLVELRDSFGELATDDTLSRSRLRADGDRFSHELIAKRLAQARPNDAILSEEGVDLADRDDAYRVWIVDPLDGTWEYGQGRDDFAVHIALWQRGTNGVADSLPVGVVDLPGQGVTRTTGDERTAPLTIPERRPVRIVTSRTRPPAKLNAALPAVSQAIVDAGINKYGAEIITAGSVGAKVAQLLAGRAEAYLHDSGFYEWDVAAPLAVAAHYGLVAQHIDGSPVTFNHRPTWVSDLMVCLPELVPILRAVG